VDQPTPRLWLARSGKRKVSIFLSYYRGNGGLGVGGKRKNLRLFFHPEPVVIEKFRAKFVGVGMRESTKIRM